MFVIILKPLISDEEESILLPACLLATSLVLQIAR